MQELARTTDMIKLSALRAALESAGVAAEIFDGAAGALLQAAIPLRLMVADADRRRADQALRDAGFHRAADNDWDL